MEPVMREPWLRALDRWETERSAADYLLAWLQSAPVRSFPNRERWVRGATLIGEWRVRMPPGFFDGWTPGGGETIWRPRLVLTDAA